MIHRWIMTPGRRCDEAFALLRIGGPLTLTAMANMSLAITDVIMMGWIGALQLGAGAAISDLYSILFYLAAGIASGGTPILSSLIGANHAVDLRRAFLDTLAATCLAGVLLAPVVWHGATVLGVLGIESAVLPDATRYAHWMAATLLPMLVVRTCVSWFSATQRTQLVLVATLCTIPLNIIGNGMFMFGWLGAPAMGMPGAGVSSFLVAIGLAAGLLVAVLRSGRWRAAGASGPSLRGIVDCWTTGLPIGVSSLAEYGVFLGSTVFMVTFGAAAVAAHAVAMRLSGVLFALSLGISQAATVRVAYWQGAGDGLRVRVTAATAMTIAGAICLFDCLLLWLFAEPIVSLFLVGEDAGSPAFVLAVVLVGILAPVEGIGAFSTVAIGALRGLKDTRTPMVHSLAGLWGVGVPVAIYLSLTRSLGATGIWWGLLAGSVVVTLLVVARSFRMFRSPRQRPIDAHSLAGR